MDVDSSFLNILQMMDVDSDHLGYISFFVIGAILIFCLFRYTNRIHPDITVSVYLQDVISDVINSSHKTVQPQMSSQRVILQIAPQVSMFSDCIIPVMIYSKPLCGQREPNTETRHCASE